MERCVLRLPSPTSQQYRSWDFVFRGMTDRSAFSARPVKAMDGLVLLSLPQTSSKSKFCDESSAMTGNAILCRELSDVCSIVEGTILAEFLNATEPPKPFAAFGSFRQRNGDGFLPCANGSRSRKCISSEAPAKLSTGSWKNNSGQCQSFSAKHVVTDSSPSTATRSQVSSEPIDITPSSETRAFGKIRKHKSFSNDIDRDEAWERKRDLFVVDELQDLDNDSKSRNIGRSASDCGDRAWPRTLKGRPRSKTRSLTDEDLEELRGCIDLGFGFKYDVSCDLRSTLPALDLYCAINRQYNDMKCRSSPVSPLDGISLERSTSVDSSNSPLRDSWRISSPGDHPNQVKTRLRHWAQAVACSIRQGSF